MRAVYDQDVIFHQVFHRKENLYMVDNRSRTCYKTCRIDRLTATRDDKCRDVEVGEGLRCGMKTLKGVMVECSKSARKFTRIGKKAKVSKDDSMEIRKSSCEQ